MIPHLVHSSPVRLIDGPLVVISPAQTVVLMADTLIEDGCPLEKPAAMRCLLKKGFSAFRAARYVEDAMANVVARAMVEP